MIRLTSTAETFTSAEWTPADETLLQLSTTGNATIDIQSRVHGDAAWVSIDCLKNEVKQMTRIAKVPFLRLVMAYNASGTTVIVRDNT